MVSGEERNTLKKKVSAEERNTLKKMHEHSHCHQNALKQVVNQSRNPY
jgi:hypothetical protein